jgi:hypothetical protein
MAREMCLISLLEGTWMGGRKTRSRRGMVTMTIVPVTAVVVVVAAAAAVARVMMKPTNNLLKSS